MHCFASKERRKIAQNIRAELPSACLEVFWMLRWQREMRIEPKDKEEQRDWNIWNNFQAYICNKYQEVGKSLHIQENSRSLVSMLSPHTSSARGKGPSPGSARTESSDAKHAPSFCQTSNSTEIVSEHQCKAPANYQRSFSLSIPRPSLSTFPK